MIQKCTKFLGEKSEKDFEFDEKDDLMSVSKFKLALDFSVVNALEKGLCQDVEFVIENDLKCPEELLFKFLLNNPDFLSNNPKLAEKLWFEIDFQPKILELIFKANSQFFVDEVEENLNFYLVNNCEIGAPKFVYFCAVSKIAYERLIEILVHYAHEMDFDVKMCQIISDILTNIHSVSQNPLALQKDNLKPLITLLLFPPNENASQQFSSQIMQKWSQIFQKYPDDAKNLCILYLPWLKCILKNHPNFQIFLDLAK